MEVAMKILEMRNTDNDEILSLPDQGDMNFYVVNSTIALDTHYLHAIKNKIMGKIWMQSKI